MMQHQHVSLHRRRTVTGSDGLIPNDGWPFLRPAINQVGFRRNVVAVRAKEFWPVSSGSELSESDTSDEPQTALKHPTHFIAAQTRWTSSWSSSSCRNS